MRSDLVLLRGVPDAVKAQLEAHFCVHTWGALDAKRFPSNPAPAARFLVAGSDATNDFQIDRALLSALPNLEFIASYGVGVEHIDLQAAEELGIVVTNTPSGVDEEVADFAIGLLISTVREIAHANEFLKSGRWRHGAYPLSRGTLRGRKLGVVGLGSIGLATARRASAFGLPVSYFGRSQKAGVDYQYYRNILELAEAVDTLIIAVAGGDGTRGIVNAEVLKKLGPSGVLINVARGSVVDEGALIKALRSGQILAAGLDVLVSEPDFNPEFLKLENVLLTPHIASASVSTRQSMWQLLVDNLRCWQASRSSITPVRRQILHTNCGSAHADVN